MHLFRRESNTEEREAPVIRTFSSGANRDTADGKHEYAGYLSPLVLQRFGQYMTQHRHLPDGTLRASDNWQKGIPRDVYEQSLWRHVIDWWSLYRGWPGVETQDIQEALCGILFNTMGFLHETLKEAQSNDYLDLLSEVPSATGFWAPGPRVQTVASEPETGRAASDGMSGALRSRVPDPWTCPDPAHHETHGAECPGPADVRSGVVGDEAPGDEPAPAARPDEGSAAGDGLVPAGPGADLPARDPVPVEPAGGCWCDMAPKPHDPHLMRPNFESPEDLGDHLYVFTQEGLTAWVPV